MRQAIAVPGTKAILAAAIMLLLGTLVYIFDRPASVVSLFAPFSLEGSVPALFGALGQSLPTFAHVFAFAVMTGVLIGRDRASAAFGCIAWFCIDAAFELGQHPVVAAQLQDVVPATLASQPVMARVLGYFVHGTFDWMDMLSIVAGAVAAYLVLRYRRGTGQS